jgi:hypothetical protein
MAPKTPLPTKFAVAEKHTAHLSVAKITLVVGERKTFLAGRSRAAFHKPKLLEIAGFE